MTDVIIARNFYTTPPDGRIEPLTQFKSWLLDPNPETLQRISESGTLGKLIPEWQRLTSDRNIQHTTHHFPLNIHTLAVVEGTRQAPGFDELTEYEQFITLLAALLHDIDKRTGPERLRHLMAVDKLHPIRSAEMSKTILMRLGCSWPTIQRVYTLIHHHQVFGRLFIFFPDGAPLAATDKIALKTRSFSLLKSLVAINEGDIRGVKSHSELFTPDVAKQLPVYYQHVEDRISHYAEKNPLLPQQLGYSTGDSGPTLTHFAGFVLPANTEAELAEKLAAWPWGGAQALPYTADFDPDQFGPYAALVHVLPENISYWGPALPGITPGQVLSMKLFYALCQADLLGTEQLSPLELKLLQSGSQQQAELQGHLAALAEHLEAPDWVSLYQKIELQTFGGPRTAHPWDVHCLQHLLHQYPEDNFWGIITRPILMGLMSPEPVPHLASSAGVPNFTRSGPASPGFGV